MPEVDIQRTLTRAFINTMPVTITLVPRVKVQKPAGGFTWQEQAARDPQVMRLIEPSTVNGIAPNPIVTGDGVERRIEFTLLGAHDAIIGLYDVFEHAGHEWEVVQVAHPLPWEQRASVARRG